MREIHIDLSSDNYLQNPKVFGGYAGEHNESKLLVKLPDRMIRDDISYYYFEFQTVLREHITSPNVYKNTLSTNNEISIVLWEQLLTSAGNLSFCINAINIGENGVVTVKGKTSVCTLYISESPTGEDVLIDPKSSKEELQKSIDSALKEAKDSGEFKGDKGKDGADGVDGTNGTDGYTPQKGVDYFTAEDIAGLNIPSIDQTYSPTSENAQSGIAVAQAVHSKIPKVSESGENSYPKALVVKRMPQLEAIDGIPYPTDSDYIHLSVDDGYLKDYVAPSPPDVSITKGFIATRDTSTGNLWTGIPVDDVDCANKKYVDDKISAIPSGGAVDDVQINGESIVTDGVANIPLASNSKSGVVTGSNTGGIRVLANGTIVTQVAENVIIDNRTYPNQIISTQNLDYAVKAAMCDGKGAAWTEEEQASARKRIGVCDYELIDEFTLEEEVNTITRNLEPDGTPYNFKSMAILIYVPAHINADVMFSFDGKYSVLVSSTLWSDVIKTTNTYSSLVLKNIGTNLFELYKGSGNQWEYPGSTVALRHNKYSNSQGDEIRRFVFGANNSVNTLPVGTNIKIYGVRVNYENK